MALSLQYISVPEWLPSLPYISVPEWLPSLPYLCVPEWLASLQYISVPEWLPSLQYISVPEWLPSLQYISVPEWLPSHRARMALSLQYIRARGGHSYSTRRTVRDRGQDAVKRSSRIFSTGQAVKRTFWVGQRSRPTFAQTNSYLNSYPTARFCLHCLSQQVDLTVTGACARPNWADFSPVLEPDTVIHHVWLKKTLSLSPLFSSIAALGNNHRKTKDFRSINYAERARSSD